MNDKLKKFLLYVSAVVVFSGLCLAIYDILNLKLFHMERVRIFCDESIENVGIEDTRSLEALKAYIGDKERFENLSKYEIDNFFDDTVHITNCTEGLLFSKRYNGARSVVLELPDQELVLTVLTAHLTFEEEKDHNY